MSKLLSKLFDSEGERGARNVDLGFHKVTPSFNNQSLVVLVVVVLAAP